MQLVHPDNLPKGQDQGEMFGKDVRKLRSTLEKILSSGEPRKMALEACKTAVDDPVNNLGMIRRMTAALLVNPYIFEFMGAKEDSYIERVFLTVFASMNIEPDPIGEPTVPFKIVRKED